MVDELSASQISEWMVYAGLEPFGPEVDNERFGMVCSSILNGVLTIMGDPKKIKRWYEPSDFFPDRIKEPDPQPKKKEKQSVEKMREVLKAIARGRS